MMEKLLARMKVSSTKKVKSTTNHLSIYQTSLTISPTRLYLTSIHYRKDNLVMTCYTIIQLRLLRSLHQHHEVQPGELLPQEEGGLVFGGWPADEGADG